MSRRSVLVTGCSDGGLGASLALAFHKEGYRVIATARNINKMAQMKSNGIETISLDVQSQESLKNAAIEVGKILDGKLDMLVNNAGAGLSMPVMDIELDEIRKLFDLNVFSLISTSRAFLPLLRRAGHGTIVNNTSIAAGIGPPMQAAYNASKAAASCLTNNLRLELEPFGIRVVELKTGAVKTNFFANVGSPKLPADSIYTPAKDEIERFLKGGDIMTKAMTADTWAQRVVGDLSKSTPSHVIWRGTQASLARLITFFPVHCFDSLLRSIVGLDVLVKRLRAGNAEMKRA